VRILSLLQFLAAVFATLVAAPMAIVLSLLGWQRAAYVPVRLWARFLHLATGVRFRVQGLENIPGSESYIVVSNHCSHLDGPTLALALPHPVYFVIKKELTRIPLWGQAAVALGFIAVDRSNSAQARAEMARAVDTIKGGRRVLVFAEGTRSTDGHLQRFKKGGFHLAIDAQVPILPVTVNNSHRLFPKHGRVVRSGTLDVIIGRAVPTSGLGKEHLEQLMEQTREIILDARRRDPDFRDSR
jgi:1-acyl-sn-glycerol-3-phosphate acyltransferase